MRISGCSADVCASDLAEMQGTHGRIGPQAPCLRHELGPQFGRAVDGDAGRGEIGILAGIDLELRHVQSGGAEVQAYLLAHGPQGIARTLDGQARRTRTAIERVAAYAGTAHEQVEETHGSLPEARERFVNARAFTARSEEHTSELQSLMRISYAV